MNLTRALLMPLTAILSAAVLTSVLPALYSQPAGEQLAREAPPAATQAPAAAEQVRATPAALALASNQGTLAP